MTPSARAGLQTCYHVEAASTRFIIDCGATALIGFSKLGSIPIPSTVGLLHLHGDHFGGLVWWLVHAQHVAKRTTALTVVGPEGVQTRFEAAAETLFQARRPFRAATICASWN